MMTKLRAVTRETLIRWFYKIEEPRVQRLLYFAFYVLIVIAGVYAFTDSSPRFFQVGGWGLIVGLGLSFVFGGIMGALAIIPGAWYLERVGLVSIGFGLLYRGILILSLEVSTTGAFIFYGTVILLLIRFIQIRRADLAPIRG